MKVTSKYSTIEIIKSEDIRPAIGCIIIQADRVDNNQFIVEIIKDIDCIEKYRNEQPKQQLSLAEQNKREQLENEYNDALEIVLNNDPQGKWSGCTLAEILAKDVEWFKWAKAEMRNPYIKKFVCVICEHDNIK